MNKILEYLEHLDLSEIEAKIYLQLLKTGAISVSDLAITMGINRTTTYVYVDQLIDKELVVKIVKGSRTQVAAIQPEKMLPYLVEQKIAHTKKIQEELPAILKDFGQNFPKVEESGEAEIKYYKGKLGVKKIYEEILKSKEQRSYVDTTKIPDVFPENFQLFRDALTHNSDIKMFEIFQDSPTTKDYIDKMSEQKNYSYKILPKEMKLTAQDIIIYDGKVAIISFKDGINGVILQNHDLYNNFKILFDLMWKLLPDMENKQQ